jgi:hypothetical protein
VFTSLSIERRKYTCDICGAERVILTKPIEKWVAVCIHEQSRGGPIPVMQLREEGELVRD